MHRPTRHTIQNTKTLQWCWNYCQCPCTISEFLYRFVLFVYRLLDIA